MSRYLSTAGLAGRVIWRVLAITALAALAVGALLMRLPLLAPNEAYVYRADTVLWPIAMEEVARRSLAPVACLIGFAGLMAVLSLNGCGFGTRSDYTVRRLQVEEWAAELMWAGCYTACVVFYWAVMAAVCWWAVGQRLTLLAADPTWSYLVGPQSRMLAFYSGTFFHHLLPLADVVVWVENAVLAVMCGSAAVRFSRRQRRGHLSIAPLLALFLTAASFSFRMGGVENYSLALAAVVTAAYNLLRRGEEEDEALVQTTP